MKANARSHARRKEAFHKYLKPGALAQLRDSKINARSQRPSALSPHFVGRSVESAQTQDQILLFDQIPAFLDTICRGRVCLRRKKLVATRSSLLLDLNASASSLESSNGSDSGSGSSRNGDNLLINVVHSDVVVAH